MGLTAFLFLVLSLLSSCTSSTPFDDISNRSVRRDQCENDFDCQDDVHNPYPYTNRCFDGVCKDEVTGNGITNEEFTNEEVTNEEVTNEEVTNEEVTNEEVTNEEFTHNHDGNSSSKNSSGCLTHDDCSSIDPLTPICARSSSGVSSCVRKVSVYEECEVTEQCPQDSYCVGLDRVKRCRCYGGYRFDFRLQKCLKPTPAKPSDDSVRALEIYKITMIFASCLLALVLVSFLYCIIKKSFCGSRSHPNSGPPDIMTLFAESAGETGSPFGLQPPFEKPPTYDESQNHMRQVFGVPPPSYPGPSTAQCGQEVPTPSTSSTAPRVPTVPMPSPTVPRVREVTPETAQETGVENRGFQSE